MAERIVSPGVFTNEKDQSFLQRGVSEIGASIIGTTIKGPAQIPTKINSFSEFQEIFGGYTDESYVPFTVQEYLKNAGVMTVTRLLYEDGYQLDNGSIAIMASSASVGPIVTHVLHPTAPVSTVGAGNDVFQKSFMVKNPSGSFVLNVSGSFNSDSSLPGFSGAYLQEIGISSSIDSTKNNYITKIFGTNPKGVNYPVYVQYENASATSLFNDMAHVSMSLDISTLTLLQDFQPGTTPFVTSQKIGTTSVNLFKIHTLSHGNAENVDVKVGIRDIRVASEVADPNGYGTFTVEIRKVNNGSIPNSPFDSDDTDKTPDIVESFTNCNLDPDSPNYIARKIGDQYITIDSDGKIRDNGEYPNASSYVRVEVTNSVKEKTLNKILVPFGSRALSSPIGDASGSAGDGTQSLVSASMSLTQTVGGSYSGKNYHGFDFTSLNNLNYLAPIPTANSTTASNADFYLGDVSQSSGANFPSVLSPYTGSIQNVLDANTIGSNVALQTRKFMVPFQGGFDGARPNLPKLSGTNITATNTFGFDCSGNSTTGTKAYRKAFAALSNTDFFDINMLLTPGILHSKHTNVTSEARQMAEERQDTFYVMDVPALTDSITTTINNVTSLDSNYTATYFPWVRIIDPAKNKPIFVPPSVLVPGALSFNDATSAPWYAPAGLNRGGLTAAINTYEKLTQADRDSLYEARINPIANFPNQGICIWGQKTLQSRPSALDRVNVRRLLITVKKFIASATKFLVFEQNTDATRLRFLSIVNPYLEGVRSQQGLSAFRVVMDDTNNTPDLIDQNILYGQIFLQPTRTAEFIVLDFNIQPTGASFPE
tara:strand:+ start:882 stop:3353 length:2472 start_codon:yes stop_codon:yes gene_type:complete